MINKDYIVGLVDGEGSFTAYISSPFEIKDKKRRVKAEPKFCLKLIEKDKDILYALKQFFGCGNIYFQKDNRLNHQNCYRYEITDRNDLENKIIPFFKKNPPKLKSKQKDFALFCRIFDEIRKGNHLRKEGLSKIYNLKNKMH